MESVYHIVPAGMRPFYILLPIACLVVLAPAFLGWTLYGSQRASFVVDDRGISFHGDFYGNPIAWKELQVDSAQVVDLAAHPELTPRFRRIGTAAPGYQSGWFTLRDGSKALLYLTDRSKALYLPTTKGFVVLMSPDRPEAMLAELRRRASTVRPSP